MFLIPRASWISGGISTWGCESGSRQMSADATTSPYSLPSALGWVCQSARHKLRPEDTVEVSLKRWIELATLSGARALGLDHKIGSLEVGKEADMFLADVQSLRLTDGFEDKWLEQLLTLLVFRYRPGTVRATWVRGRSVSGPGIFETKERQFRSLRE